jgi:hypothetical protein
MGPQPVVKKYADGSEVVYTMIRGDNRSGFDGRWDSHFGEMVLDNQTVPGYEAGYVRWIEYGNYGWPVNGNSEAPPTDEQANITVAGNHILGAHWALGYAMELVDRSSGFGAFTNPIISNPIPNIALMTNASEVPQGFSSTHFVPYDFGLATTGESRAIPPGFYIYWNQGKIYDMYWSDYAVWVVSNDTVYFQSVDGAIIAFEHAESVPLPMPNPAKTLTPTPTPTPLPPGT